ncbi:MAG: hypothetical protein JNL50_00375 [Phycisphaerae bacterium]|nr:hypothetical protein [Phycisphaerae bacterium]
MTTPTNGHDGDAIDGENAGLNPMPAMWTAWVWGVALPCAVCLAGAWLAGVNKGAAGWFLLLWPIAAVGGMAMGCVALMQRLARGKMSNARMFLLVAGFGVLCLAIQGAMALWLGGVVRGK